MKKDERFIKTYSQGTMSIIEIWIDKETGVNYMFRSSGYAGGLTPLLDDKGNVIVTVDSEYIDMRNFGNSDMQN